MFETVLSVVGPFPREGGGQAKFLTEGFARQISTLLDNSIFPDVLEAHNAIPAKVWALSGKENGCWKIGPAPQFFYSETATTFLSFLNCSRIGRIISTETKYYNCQSKQALKPRTSGFSVLGRFRVNTDCVSSVGRS